MRVLELYSGIGGMHWALLQSGISYEVVMAVDINVTANRIYQQNFPESNLQCFGIEKLTVKKMKELRVDAIFMSPPCQPFTRVGKKGDSEDKRTLSFLRILKLLKEIEPKPCYILVENVKGFETSHTHSMLLETLQECSYNIQEFLLTPLQFGIPNCRLRYYLTAKLKNKSFCYEPSKEILYTLPHKPSACPSDSRQGQTERPGDLSDTSDLNCHSNNLDTQNKRESSNHRNTSLQPCTDMEVANKRLKTDPSCKTETSVREFHVMDDQPTSRLAHGSTPNQHSKFREQDVKERVADEDSKVKLMNAGRNMRYCEDEDAFINAENQPLSNFMEKDSSDFSSYLLSDKNLRQFVVMDIVFPALKKSICFTKRYGHYIDGAGSVVQMSTNVEDTKAASQMKCWAVEKKNKSEWGEPELSVLRKLQLRYFTPREVANLLCFPPEFEFPDGLNTVQKFRVLGNSLNVRVVAELIKLLTQGDIS